MTEVLAGTSSQDVLTVRPEATVLELVELLDQHNIGALVVSGDGAGVDGVVSERDVVRHLRRDDDLPWSPVSAIMSSPIRTCSGPDTVEEVTDLMTERRFRHVPVREDRQHRHEPDGGAAVRARPAGRLGAGG